MINSWEDVEKKEPSDTAGGNVNWCGYYGEQCGGSLGFYLTSGICETSDNEFISGGKGCILYYLK